MKHLGQSFATINLTSPPARGRGLKPGLCAMRFSLTSSPPARGRGLKPLLAVPDTGAD